MLDPIQIALTCVISVLAVILFIVGLEVFQILKELKKTLEKINKILDDTGRISESVAAPVEEASEFLIGLKKGMSFLNSVTKLSKFFKKEKEVEVKDVKPKKPVSKKPASSKSRKKSSLVKTSKAKKRFFTRKGKSLVKTS